MPEPDVKRPLWQTVFYFAAMIGILVFANWGKPDGEGGFWHTVWTSSGQSRRPSASRLASCS
jgi:hypothetical protein